LGWTRVLGIQLKLGRALDGFYDIFRKNGGDGHETQMRGGGMWMSRIADRKKLQEPDR